METKRVQQQVLNAFALVVKQFPPALCESHRPAWARNSLYSEPDPLWFIMWDPAGVEYDWEHADVTVGVRWVPGSEPKVFLTFPHEERPVLGVDMRARAAELESQLCRHLVPIDQAEAQKVILSLDEVLTETFERRAQVHAPDCLG